MSRPSTILFALVFTFALCLLGWWVLFETWQADALDQAGARLRAGDAQGVATAFGADDGHGLQALARRRRAMFLSEGVAFGLVLLVAGVLFVVALRREARLHQDHDRFLAGATHELKTPLATVRLLLESLQAERVPPDKRARYFAAGLLELERLERGLTNLLTVAGLRGAGHAVYREPGDLAADAREAIAAMATRAEAAGIQLCATEMTAVPCSRDPDRIQLVLRNLLDNAVKYSNPGATVALTVRRDGADAVVSVADQGRGLTPADLQRAFQPFFRGAGQAAGGAGLGLFLVRELVRAHGGSVAIHSPGPGRGATVTVRLPASGGAA